jgi:hypothetical protein
MSNPDFSPALSAIPGGLDRPNLSFQLSGFSELATFGGG